MMYVFEVKCKRGCEKLGGHGKETRKGVTISMEEPPWLVSIYKRSASLGRGAATSTIVAILRTIPVIFHDLTFNSFPMVLSCSCILLWPLLLMMIQYVYE